MFLELHDKSKLKVAIIVSVSLNTTAQSAQYLRSKRAFLFSIVNPAGLGPVKLHVKPHKLDKALRRDPTAGPIFGENDLYIGDYSHGSAVSFSDLGHAYDLPNNTFEAGSLDARTFLAGSYKFIPDNIEVFGYAGMY